MQAKAKKFYAVNAISRQHTFFSFFSELVEFFLKIIDLVFWEKPKKVKITSFLQKRK